MHLLVKNLDDFSTHVTVTGDFDFDIIKPYITKVQMGDVQRIFGSTFITGLASRYNAAMPSPTLTAQELALIEMLGNYISHLALAQALPVLLAQLGASGLFQKEGQNSKPIFQWQKLEYEEAQLEMAYNALESALDYLIENRTHTQFAAWKDSAQEKASVSLFVHNAAIFNRTYPIGNSRRTYEAVKPFAAEVEKFDIRYLLGQALYDELKFQKETFALSEDNAKLLPYIQDVIANASIVKSLGRLNVKTTAEGLMITSYISNGKEMSRNRIPATASEIAELKVNAIAAANQYKAELMRYLFANLNKYPLWAQSEEYIRLTAEDELNTDESSSVIL
jgi:hypothetical protein